MRKFVSQMCRNEHAVTIAISFAVWFISLAMLHFVATGFPAAAQADTDTEQAHLLQASAKHPPVARTVF